MFASKYADEGNDRQAVLLPSGEKVGQITIKAPVPSAWTCPTARSWTGAASISPPPSRSTSTRRKVGSLDVIAAVRDKLPDCIRTRVRPATAKALAEEIVTSGGHAG